MSGQKDRKRLTVTAVTVRPSVRALQIYPTRETKKKIEDLDTVGIRLSRKYAMHLARVLLAMSQDFEELEICARRFKQRKSDGTYEVTVTSPAMQRTHTYKAKHPASVSTEQDGGVRGVADSIPNKNIEVTPGVRGGRPRIAGRRITVDDVVIMHLRLGQSIEEIVAKYKLSFADVHAALAYYYDHKEEVDGLIAADDDVVAAFKRNNPSVLQERLRALRDG
jgi:uncharacterized protein (DUF433 family)